MIEESRNFHFEPRVRTSSCEFLHGRLRDSFLPIFFLGLPHKLSTVMWWGTGVLQGPGRKAQLSQHPVPNPSQKRAFPSFPADVFKHPFVTPATARGNLDSAGDLRQSTDQNIYYPNETVYNKHTKSPKMKEH